MFNYLYNDGNLEKNFFCKIVATVHIFLFRNIRYIYERFKNFRNVSHICVINVRNKIPQSFY